MTVLPWRVRNFVSEHFPVIYHVAANAESLRRLLSRYFSIIGLEGISDRNFEIPILFAHIMFEARTGRAAAAIAPGPTG